MTDTMTDSVSTARQPEQTFESVHMSSYLSGNKSAGMAIATQTEPIQNMEISMQP